MSEEEKNIDAETLERFEKAWTAHTRRMRRRQRIYDFLDRLMFWRREEEPEFTEEEVHARAEAIAEEFLNRYGEEQPHGGSEDERE